MSYLILALVVKYAVIAAICTLTHRHVQRICPNWDTLLKWRLLRRRKSKNTNRTVLTEKYPPSPPPFDPGYSVASNALTKTMYSSVVSQTSHSVTYQGHITYALRLALDTQSHSQTFVLLHEIRESAKVERDKPASPPPALMSSGTALGTHVWYMCVLACCSHLPSILIERNHED